MGMPEALTATLPYSKEEFTVPPNLHLIGTMNTADRSVEALDTALRRRFEFEAVEPRIDLLPEGEVDGIEVRTMLKTINDRIEKLLDKDHCIGHSYLMKVGSLKDIQTAFARQILPLLEEYFYGDMAKIGMVLGDRFVRKTAKTSSFAKGDWGFDDYEERAVCELEDPMTVAAEGFASIYA
jgi:5-methylcytosine-specific restriction endonuclease McrBC GTP-binding regulatory subunit McrB